MKLSFKEKSIWTSLITTTSIFGYFIIKMIGYNKNPDITNITDIRYSFIIIVLLIVIFQIVLQSILAAIYKKEAQDGDDERDRVIEMKATKLSHLILVKGVWITGLCMFFNITPFYLVQILMSYFIISELTGNIAQLYHYRRGV